MFALTLVLVSIGLILLFFQARKLLTSYATQFEKSLLDLRNMVATSQLELTSRISEMSGEDLRKSAIQFETGIKTMLRCVNRMEMAALAMGDMAKMMVSESALPSNTLPAEAYAEPDTDGGKYITQSDAAKRDASTLDDM